MSTSFDERSFPNTGTTYMLTYCLLKNSFSSLSQRQYRYQICIYGVSEPGLKTQNKEITSGLLHRHILKWNIWWQRIYQNVPHISYITNTKPSRNSLPMMKEKLLISVCYFLHGRDATLSSVFHCGVSQPEPWPSEWSTRSTTQIRKQIFKKFGEIAKVTRSM